MGAQLAAAEETRAPSPAPRTTEERVTRRRPIRRVPPAVVALLVYSLLTVLLFRAGWASPTTRNIGGPNDSLFNMWTLRWTPWAVAHGHNPLFTDHLNFPFGVNMMWNALIPLHSLLLWPVTSTAGVVTAYNLFVTLNVVFSAWCAYLAARVFVSSERAAFVGGLVYGFCPFMMAQSLDHPTLTAAYIPPLLLLVLHQILVRQTRSALRMGAILGLLATVQLFTAEEMLAAQALVGALGLCILVALHPRSVAPRIRHALVAMAGAAAVFLLLTSWALHFQFFGPQRLSGGSVQLPSIFVSDLANFIVPTKVQQVAPHWAVAMSTRWTGNPSEWDAYMGVPLLVALVVIMVKLRHRPVVAFAGLLAAITAVLSLGPSLHVNKQFTSVPHETGFPLPWRAVEQVPLLGHILPGRLMIFVFLCVALLLAVAVERLLAVRSWRTKLAGGVAAAIIAVSIAPDLSYPSTQVSVPPFFTGGSATIIPEGSVALIAPMQQLFPADPMLWQAEAGMRFRMPQGYFFAPDAHGNPLYGAPYSTLTLRMYDIQAGRQPAELTPELRLAIAQDLAIRQVQTVVVGPMDHQGPMVEFFRSLFDQAPERIGGVYVWQRTHRLLRYRA